MNKVLFISLGRKALKLVSVVNKLENTEHWHLDVNPEDVKDSSLKHSFLVNLGLPMELGFTEISLQGEGNFLERLFAKTSEDISFYEKIFIINYLGGSNSKILPFFLANKVLTANLVFVLFELNAIVDQNKVELQKKAKQNFPIICINFKDYFRGIEQNHKLEYELNLADFLYILQDTCLNEQSRFKEIVKYNYGKNFHFVSISLGKSESIYDKFLSNKSLSQDLSLINFIFFVSHFSEKVVTGGTIEENTYNILKENLPSKSIIRYMEMPDSYSRVSFLYTKKELIYDLSAIPFYASFTKENCPWDEEIQELDKPTFMRQQKKYEGL